MKEFNEEIKMIMSEIENLEIRIQNLQDMNPVSKEAYDTYLLPSRGDLVDGKIMKAYVKLRGVRRELEELLIEEEK